VLELQAELGRSTREIASLNSTVLDYRERVAAAGELSPAHPRPAPHLHCVSPGEAALLCLGCCLAGLLTSALASLLLLNLRRISQKEEEEGDVEIHSQAPVLASGWAVKDEDNTIDYQ